MGRKLDDDGKLSIWWSKKTATGNEQKAQRFADQKAQYGQKGCQRSFTEL